MTAVLILAFSVLALVQFAISQWRMIWLTTANQPISDSLHAATGIDARNPRGQRLWQTPGALRAFSAAEKWDAVAT